MNEPRELRPEEVVWSYWEEVVNLELNAERLKVAYLEVAP